MDIEDFPGEQLSSGLIEESLSELSSVSIEMGDLPN
jgi:hypothetical protein